MGGFLKKKAKEAAQAPIQQQQAQQQADEAAAKALSAPDVVPITQESTARFAGALDVEIRLRGEFRTLLASFKTREEYQACQAEVAMSPEAQKISMRVAELPDNASAADLQKLMLKSSRDLEALVEKRCGADPSQWNQATSAQRLQGDRGRGLGRLRAARRCRRGGRGGRGAARPLVGAGRATPRTDAHPHLRKYAIAKERWIPFCAAEAAKPEGKYARVKGQGAALRVYAWRRRRCCPQHCPDVMAKLNKVTEPVQSAK